MPTMSISWIAFSRFCGGFLASFRDTTFLFDHKPAGNQIEPTATVPDCPDHQFTLAPCTAPKWARVGRPSFQSGTLFIMENGMENGTKVCFWSAIVADEKTQNVLAPHWLRVQLKILMTISIQFLFVISSWLRSRRWARWKCLGHPSNTSSPHDA